VILKCLNVYPVIKNNRLKETPITSIVTIDANRTTNIKRKFLNG
jgi:hypothetical protein